MPIKKPRIYLVIALSTICVTVAACSSSGSGSATRKAGSGSVDVLYAGSLVDVMTKQVGPQFEKSSGYGVSGFSGGSTDLATDIKGKTRKADVFVSASPQADQALQGSANGNWVSWYASFAKAPLVLGFNPKSTFAAQLRTKPWYDVVTEPGFRLGKTDPATDPKGKLAAQALNETATSRKVPALAALAKSAAGVYPEETLVGRLQAGQLDAGFFYTAEAAAAKIPTVQLAGTNLAATYTATVVNHAPNEKGAEAFVAFLLSTQGKALLTKDGFELIPVTVSGTGVPAGLKKTLSH